MPGVDTGIEPDMPSKTVIGELSTMKKDGAILGFDPKGQKVIVHDSWVHDADKDAKEQWKEFVGKMDGFVACYGFQYFRIKDGEGKQLQKLIAVAYAKGDSATMKQKMWVSGTQERVHKKFNTTLDIKKTADCIDDLDFEDVVKEVTKGK